jgi:hypothetical protein
MPADVLVWLATVARNANVRSRKPLTPEEVLLGHHTLYPALSGTRKRGLRCFPSSP